MNARPRTFRLSAFLVVSVWINDGELCWEFKPPPIGGLTGKESRRLRKVLARFADRTEQLA